MTTDFNKDPYWDNFDENKNYAKVLFKPGRPVQVTELNTLQTTLQNQITKFGKFIFSEGSVVSGCQLFTDTNVRTVRLLSNTSTITNISLFVNQFVYGDSSNVIGQVIKVDTSSLILTIKPLNTKNNAKYNAGETLKFFADKATLLSYINNPLIPYVYSAIVSTDVNTTIANCSGSKYSQTITMPSQYVNIGDVLTNANITPGSVVISIIDANTVKINNPLLNTFSGASITTSSLACRTVLEVSIDTGVFFTNGMFIKALPQQIIPDVNTQYPTAVVGYEVSENIITYLNDSSLLDPALGSSNFTAPGADRYQIVLTLVSKPLVNNVPTNLTNNKFIEILRIKEGSINRISNIPMLGEIEKTLARRTFDQSGDFVVKNYLLLLNPSDSGDPNLTGSISAGKAYVQGHEFETIAPTIINIEKARDTANVTNYDLNGYYGSYTIINTPKGSLPDISVGKIIELHNVAAPSVTGSATKIGTAAYRNLQYYDTNDQQLFLFDVNITDANSTFSNTKSILSLTSGGDYTSKVFYANTTLYANGIITNGIDSTFGKPVLIDTNYTTLLFKLPQVNIKSANSISYTTRKLFSTTMTNGITTIGVGTNETFINATGTAALPYYNIITKTTNGIYTAGQYIPVNDANVTITVTGSSANVSIGGAYNGSVDIYATYVIHNADLNPRTKTLVPAYIKEVTKSTANNFPLGICDVNALNGVWDHSGYVGSSANGTWSNATTYQANNVVYYSVDKNAYISTVANNLANTPGVSPSWTMLTNQVTNYTFDSGQTDSYYDYGIVSILSGTIPTKAIVSVDYFTHSGTSSYFTGASYTGISYGNIPAYTSKSTGNKYQLRDCIDFRPRKTDNAVVANTTYQFGANQIPAPIDFQVYINYSYYLSRIDKIALSYNGEFKTIRGVSSYTNLVPPSDVPDAMTLFTLNIPAYTFNSSDIQSTYSDHKRYTMADIARLDKRIQNVEYYAALSLLEKEVLGKDVINSSNNIQFKNGFLVDSFTGHGVGDVLNPDYACAVDFTNKYARPKFITSHTKYDLDLTNPPFNKGDSLITFPYTEVPFITQQIATKFNNINPFNVISYIGKLDLSPQSDVWYDTVTRPIINIVNQDNSAWQNAQNQVGTQWNDWQVVFTGQPIVSESTLQSTSTSVTTRQVTQTPETLNQTGIQTTLSSKISTVSDTTSIVSSEIIPYARAIDIQFKATGLPPFTKMYVYANDILISGYVTPAFNPMGTITSTNILNGGTGYLSGGSGFITSTTISSSNNTITATANATITAGVVTSVAITNDGANYDPTNNMTITGANTSPAIILASTTPVAGSDLYTDETGFCSGIISLPNNSVLKFPVGKIRITICDHVYSLALAGSYAEADFISSGVLQTIQETVTSTKEPVLIRSTVTSSKTATETTVRDITTPVNVPNTTIPGPKPTSNPPPVDKPVQTTVISPTITVVPLHTRVYNGTTISATSITNPFSNGSSLCYLIAKGQNSGGNDTCGWQYTITVPAPYTIVNITKGRVKILEAGGCDGPRGIKIIKISGNTAVVNFQGYFGLNPHTGKIPITITIK